MISPLRTARAVSSSPQGHCSKIWGCLCTAQGMILHWEVLSCEQLEFWGSNLKFWGIRFFVGLRFESVPISVRWCPLSFCPSILWVLGHCSEQTASPAAAHWHPRVILSVLKLRFLLLPSLAVPLLHHPSPRCCKVWIVSSAVKEI